MSRLHTVDSPTINKSRETVAANDMANGKRNDLPSNGKPAETSPSQATADVQAGTNTASATEAEKQSTDISRVDRAEELADTIAVGVAMFAAKVGRSIVSVAAHVGEALADTWAEAQSIRKGKK